MCLLELNAVTHKHIEEDIAFCILGNKLLAADALCNAIEGTAQSKELQSVALYRGEVDTFGKIEDVAIRTILFSLVDD